MPWIPRPAALAALAALVLAACGGGSAVAPDGAPDPADGAAAWRIGAAGTDDGTHLQVDTEGGVYAGGHFSATVDFDAGPAVAGRTANGQTDLYLLRLRPTGELDWLITLGSAGADGVRHVALDQNRNVYLAGYASGGLACPGATPPAAAGQRDMLVAKFSGSGICQWVVTIGSPRNDELRAVTTDALGYVYVTGVLGGRADVDPGPVVYQLGPADADTADLFVAQFDPQGRLGWARTVGGPGDDEGTAIIADAAGNAAVGGGFSGVIDADPGPGSVPLTSAGGQDILLLRFDRQGRLFWGSRAGGPGRDVVGTGLLALDLLGNPVTAGTVSGGADFGAAGRLAGWGRQDLFLAAARVDNGAFTFALDVGGPGDETIRGFRRDAAGSLYLAGSFQETVDFTRGAGRAVHTSAGSPVNGSSDPFVAKYGRTGDLVWVAPFPADPAATGASQGGGIGLSGATGMWVTGRFHGTVDFDPGTGTARRTSAGGADVFLVELDRTTGALIRR